MKEIRTRFAPKAAIRLQSSISSCSTDKFTCCAKATSVTNPNDPIVHNCLLVSKQPNKQSREYPHIAHTVPQTALHRLRMPPKHIHDARPAQRRKRRPPIPRQLPLDMIGKQSLPGMAVVMPMLVCMSMMMSMMSAMPPPLHRQLRQRQHHPRKHINYNLLANRVLDIATKNDIAAQQARDKAIVAALLARGACAPQQKHRGFVDEGEEAEVAGVLARGFPHEVALCA